MEEPELTTVTEVVSNGEVDDDTQNALISNLRQLREDAVDVFGSTKELEVPGYQGLLSVQYQYISSEVTEKIARDIRRETKNVNGIGTNLLASLDTLIAASKNVLVRNDIHQQWRPIKDHPVNFRSLELSKILDYAADDSRDIVLQLYGSEHSIIEANVILSRWLTDRTRTADEDFLG